MIVAVGFPIYLASYPPAAPETKFGEARLLLVVVFGAPVHMLPPVFDGDMNFRILFRTDLTIALFVALSSLLGVVRQLQRNALCLPYCMGPSFDISSHT